MPVEPKRIAFVSTMRLPWGGSEELWSLTALQLRELGHEVAISVFGWPQRPSRIDHLASAGARIAFRPVVKSPMRRVVDGCLQRVRPHPLELADRMWLKRECPDLVVISQGGPWDGVPWMLACAEMGLPYCGIVQANSEIWWPVDAEFKNICRAVSSAKRMFFVSRSNYLLMERQCGMHLSNAEVISNPWNLASNSAVPWPADSSEVHVACVARLEPRAKGQDILFELFALPKWRERPIHLNLYGTGNAEKSLRALASLFKLNKVHFHGQVSDIAGIWAVNHILALPSRFEGLPLVITEAMLSARPVITTDVAGNTELVRDNVNGFVAAAPVLPLLDEAFDRAWARRTEWRSIGARGREDALRAVPADPIGTFVSKCLLIAAEADRSSCDAFGNSCGCDVPSTNASSSQAK